MMNRISTFMAPKKLKADLPLLLSRRSTHFLKLTAFPICRGARFFGTTARASMTCAIEGREKIPPQALTN